MLAGIQFIWIFKTVVGIPDQFYDTLSFIKWSKICLMDYLNPVLRIIICRLRILNQRLKNPCGFMKVEQIWLATFLDHLLSSWLEMIFFSFTIDLILNIQFLHAVLNYRKEPLIDLSACCIWNPHHFPIGAPIFRRQAALRVQFFDPNTEYERSH